MTESYESHNQITAESRTGYPATYTYDANGNRATRVLNGVTETYTNDNGDKLTSVTWSGGSKTYGYDAAGRTTSVVTGAGTRTLSYDYEGRVTGISYPGGGSNSFTYNGLDTRVGKTDSGGTKTFMRSGVGVTDPVLSDSAANYTPGVSERRGSTTKFYGSNHLGTNTVETDSTQVVSATKIYDAFGSLVSSSGSSASPFGFAGKEGYQEDADSGLKLLGHRYYDSSTGRFITRDPVKDGRNWYTYCENRPTKAVDPDGYQVPAIASSAPHLTLVEGGAAVGGDIVIGTGWSIAITVFGGWKIGRWLDETFGLSDSIAGHIWPNEIGPDPRNGKGGVEGGRGDDPAWDDPIEIVWQDMEDAKKSGDSNRYSKLKKIFKMRKKKKDGGGGPPVNNRGGLGIPPIPPKKKR